MFFVDIESALKEQELGVILNTVTLAHWQMFCLQTSKVYDKHCVKYRWMAYSVYNCPVLAAIGCTMFYAHPYMKFSVHNNFTTGAFQWIMAKRYNTGLFTSTQNQKKKICSNIKPYTATVASDFKCFDSHMCGKTYWIRSLLQIVSCECTTARVGGARPSTIDAWQCFLFDIRDCIKEWLLCSYCPSLSPSLLIGPWDVKYVSVVLFCYILDAVLCYVWKK